jgi:ribonuclease VapC
VIVDSSAIVAILRDEPEAAAFTQLITSSPVVRISAATYVELGAVIDGSRDPVLSGALDRVLEESRVVIEPLTPSQALIARVAYQHFGKGSGHPAQLNLADCFSYALARELNEPLLFKGDDFGQTDIPFVGQPAERRRLSELLAGYGTAPSRGAVMVARP